MKTLLIVGYNAFDLGIFDEKDMKLTVIKTAIRKNLEAFAADGLEWLIFGGNLGFEYWVLEVANEMKKDYNLKFATIFPFKTHVKIGMKLIKPSLHFLNRWILFNMPMMIIKMQVNFVSIIISWLVMRMVLLSFTMKKMKLSWTI